MSSRLTPDSDIIKTLRASLLAGPLQHRAQPPRFGLNPPTRQHPRIMIGQHRHLLLVSQIDRQNRINNGNQLPQPGQLRIAPLVTT
jgi:hypothetical protein